MHQFLQILLLACTLLLASCNPTLYVPNTINTPLLGKKQDFKLNAGIIDYAPESNLDLQGAYAVSDHAAIMANTSFMSGKGINY